MGRGVIVAYTYFQYVYRKGTIPSDNSCISTWFKMHGISINTSHQLANSNKSLMTVFLIYLEFKAELLCESGPYEYQKWLGGENIVKPWETVRRCISNNKCSPSKSHNKTITRLLKTASGIIRINITEHFNCTQNRFLF